MGKLTGLLRSWRSLADVLLMHSSDTEYLGEVAFQRIGYWLFLTKALVLQPKGEVITK